VNVIDSSAWLEYFANGKNAHFFAAPILNVDSIIVPSLTLYEVFKVVCQQRGESDALQIIAVMHQGTVVALDSNLSLAAARLSMAHKLPMADSVILATAQAFNATLWTQDAHFQNFQGVKYVRA